MDGWRQYEECVAKQVFVEGSGCICGAFKARTSEQMLPSLFLMCMQFVLVPFGR
jgi:hypothetical protein